MPASQAPSVRQQRLGVALRRLRELSGLSAETAGRRLRWSASKISRIETARIGARVSDVESMLRLYKADRRLHEELVSLARAAGEKGWWTGYPEIQQSELSVFIALEDDASSALYFESQIVPGLLQTEEYARHLITGYNEIIPLSPQIIRQRLEVRLRRQALIHPPRSLAMSVVLDEAVLLRRIGDRDTMIRQLRWLVELAERPNITLRIMPLDGNHGPGLNSFILLEFAPAYPAYEVTFPPIVHTESTTAMHAQDETVTHEYQQAHRWLVSQSLDEQASVALIARLALTHWQIGSQRT